MSAGEGVVFALLRRGEGLESAQFSVGAEAVAASRQDFMGIRLMPDIPYDAVVRSVEHIVECHSQLNRSEAGGEVSGVACQLVDDVVAQLIAELRQEVDAEFSQVGRTVDAA